MQIIENARPDHEVCSTDPLIPHALTTDQPCVLYARFAQTLTALGPFGPAPQLAVALSGGADSLALVLLAAEWTQMHHGRLITVTVDHGLRPESRAEAEQVSQWMAARGIAHHILTPEHAFVSTNLQASARHWRYVALTAWCEEQNILYCLLGHHAGDQRETVALHTARGDTADGPAGMGLVRHFGRTRFLRPLLGIEKETLTAYLRARQVPWIEDPSNQNDRFRRVHMRRQLNADPAQAHALFTNVNVEGRARMERDQALAQAALACVTISSAGYADIDYVLWRALPPLLASQILADCLTTISGNIYRPRQADTQRLMAALIAAPTLCRTLHHCKIMLRRNIIRISREPARVAAPVMLHGSGYLYWDNRFHVYHSLPASVPLVLRALGRVPGYAHLPPATPSLWDRDQLVSLAPTSWRTPSPLTTVTVGFSPAKPLAAACFWWLNAAEHLG